jgi:hypothetical protein
MAESEDLELERRIVPKGGEKWGRKSGEEVPDGESKEKGQLPVYQPDRILREPQFDLLWLDGSDLRDRPLFVRKRLLRKRLPRLSRAVLSVEHVASGTDLFG